MFDLCRGQHEITALMQICMCACVQREREREGWKGKEDGGWTESRK